MTSNILWTKFSLKFRNACLAKTCKPWKAALYGGLNPDLWHQSEFSRWAKILYCIISVNVDAIQFVFVNKRNFSKFSFYLLYKDGKRPFYRVPGKKLIIAWCLPLQFLTLQKVKRAWHWLHAQHFSTQMSAGECWKFVLSYTKSTSCKFNFGSSSRIWTYDFNRH